MDNVQREQEIKEKNIYKNELELVVLQSRQNKNIHHRSTKTTKTI